MENVQKVIVSGYGQTSDREICVVEKKYFELPEDFPEIPAGYKEWKGGKAVDRLSEFFSYADYIYVLRSFESYSENYSVRSFMFWFKSCSFYILFNPENTNHEFSITISGKEYLYIKFDISGFLKFSYTSLRRKILENFGVYDFVNETELPNGLSTDFKSSVEALDVLNVDLQKNFLKIAAYLRLMNSYPGNFEKFGCKDVFQFAERRWGYGSTSVKNFLAIAEKFMSGQELLPAAEGYGYSQLVELSSVPEGALSEFNPKMTIAEIRKKKKEALEGEKVEKEEKEKAPKKEKEIDVFKTSLRAFFWGYKIPYDDPKSSGYKVYRKALREVIEKLNYKFDLGIKADY